MSEKAEGRMILTVGKEITRVNIIDGGKAVEILFSFSGSDKEKSEEVKPKMSSENFERMFPIVDIEGISLEDDFMKYKPITDREKRVWRSIAKAKNIGMKNFRIPAIDPSLDVDGKRIIYHLGRKPALGKNVGWWHEKALEFMPSKNSRIRDELEHDVVLGVMVIKCLVEEGYTVEDAWKEVCANSKNLGHYRDSKDAKNTLETTGSRRIGKCFDLGNTGKFVKKRDSSSDFIHYGGGYKSYGYICLFFHAKFTKISCTFYNLLI